MKRVLLGALLAAVAVLAASPQPSQAFTYGISVGNQTNADPAWITIYSLHKVRIETSGRVDAHATRVFHDATFTAGSYHHVRFEWMRGKNVVCDTSARLVIKGEYNEHVFGYYDGHRCSIKVG